MIQLKIKIKHFIIFTKINIYKIKNQYIKLRIFFKFGTLD